MISGVISPLIRVMTIVSLLITLVITTLNLHVNPEGTLCRNPKATLKGAFGFRVSDFGFGIEFRILGGVGVGLRSLEFGDPSPPSFSSSSRRSSMCNLRLRHLCSIGAFIITYTILGVPSRIVE